MPRTPKRKPAPVARRKQDAAFSFTMRLPPELAAKLADIASAEGRSRAKQIEVALRQFVQSYRPTAAAEPLAKHLASPTARERAVRGGRAA